MSPHMYKISFHFSISGSQINFLSSQNLFKSCDLFGELQTGQWDIKIPDTQRKREIYYAMKCLLINKTIYCRVLKLFNKSNIIEFGV